MKLSLLFFSLFLAALSFADKNKKSIGPKLNIMPYVKAEGFGVIWGFDFISKDKIILTEKKGNIWVYDLPTKKRTKVKKPPKIVEKGQGGLMDIRLHPNFKTNSWVYYSYAAKYGEGQGTVIERAKLVEKKGAYSLTEHQRLFRAEPSGNGGRHFGSRIVFDEKGFMFFTVGDRGDRALAQSLKHPNGKVFRLHDDGRVPKDNPFVGSKGVIAAIWSYGHRNPQGLFYDLPTKTLYEQEHGPRGGDEINIIKKGANYGWPEVTYGKEYWGPTIGVKKKAGTEQPIKYYVPSIAPSGLALYRGKKMPELNGQLFSGALKLTHLNMFDMKRQREKQLFKEKLKERIRDVRIAPEEGLYFSTDSGKIYSVEPF